jgi:hypothetical protein
LPPLERKAFDVVKYRRTRGRLALSWWLSGVVDRLGGGAAAIKDLSSITLLMLSYLLPTVNELSCLVVKI